MRNNAFILTVLYIFFFSAGSMFGLGEKVISLGSTFSWDLMERRQGVKEASLIRPYSVLVLDGSTSFFAGNEDVFPDLHLSFDEGRPDNFRDAFGRYGISVSPEMAAAPAPWSRNGNGAALFSGKSGLRPAEGLLTIRPGRDAIFASGKHVRNFSIEFWIYPDHLDTGEQVFLLTASKLGNGEGYFYQHIRCNASKNRLEWSFENFFFSPGGKDRKSITLSGPHLLNRSWSHHLIRFDADLGLLEYLVDGRLEAVDYATSTGREGGEVYTPVIGSDCRIDLGSRFSGLMDEFRIFNGWLEKPELAIYQERGGRAESRTLDLGSRHSSLLKIEAFGGRTGINQSSGTAGIVRNEYAGNGALKFQDHSEIKLYARISNSPYHWIDAPWIPVEPGTDLSRRFMGRYLQIGVDFYPGWNGNTSPYLSELRVVYNPAEPPPPPTHVTAVAKNGAVELSWRASHSRDVGGYMVYYGNAKGEYFGSQAILNSAVRSSPINVGNRTAVRIEGLTNGVLYYFVVAAYDKLEALEALPEPGEFSREAAARPLLQLAEDR